MKLKSKTAIITGAESGIGRAIAIRFASAGANIAIPDKDIERARLVVKEAAGRKPVNLIEGQYEVQALAEKGANVG